MGFQLVPRYIKQMVSYYVGKPIFKPDSVSISCISICNLRCGMCDVWKNNEPKSTELAYDEFIVFFRDLKQYGVKRIQFTGGEPTMKKDLFDLIAEARKIGLLVDVVTNGTLLTEERAARLVKDTHILYVSVDAPEADAHDEVRGVKGAFEKTCKGIKMLVEARRANGRYTPRINLSSTITPMGLHSPQKMRQLVEALGADGVIYNPASTVSYGYTFLKDRFAEHQERMVQFDKMIDEILEMMEDKFAPIRSNPFFLEASKHFLRGERRFQEFPCYGGGYNGPLVTADGEVLPCCSWDFSIGSLREMPFSKIWESPRAREARRKIREKSCPMCHHHTRTGDYAIWAPILFPDLKKLYKGYKRLLRFGRGKQTPAAL